MLRRSLFLLVVLVLSLAAVSVALADAPASGIVYEGVTVPGLALGDTRAEVEASVGPHASCSSVDASADYASCKFNVDGGGWVWARYRGPDGGNASNSPDDVVTYIYWYSVPEWNTTAGINTTLALENRQAVIEAYPNAEVSYTNIYDPASPISDVRDPELGISVTWNYDIYGGFTTVRMAIFKPYTPDPPTPPPPSIRVAGFEWTALRRGLIAKVLVLDNEDQPVEGAIVEATWSYPKVDGLRVSDSTDENGYATFRVNKPRRGNYYLQINDLTLEGYEYDYIHSKTLGVYALGR